MAGRLNVPNQWPRVVLLTAQSILKPSDYDNALAAAGLSTGSPPPRDMKKNFSFEQMSSLHQSLKSSLGGRRMAEFATAAGEALIKDNLAMFPSVAMAAKLAMKVGSSDAKIKLSLEFFSKYFGSVSDQQVALSEDSSNWVWMVTQCAMCAGSTSEPGCELNVGMVQGVVSWAVPDRHFDIREAECKASGSYGCVVLISKM